MLHVINMNLNHSFRNYEESRRHMPRNTNAYARAVIQQIIHIIRPTGLGPFEFERQYLQWRKRRNALNLVRRAMSRRKVRLTLRKKAANILESNRGLGSIKVAVGNNFVNLPPNIIRSISAHLTVKRR